MIATINKLISSFFGNKSERDVKAITPIIDQIHEHTQKVQNLSHDDLRARTQAFKNKINEVISPEEQMINELKLSAEAGKSLAEQEKIYEEIDALEKTVKLKIKEALDQILPEAFAVIKETAKRFTQNKTIEVMVSERDKELATQKQNVIIEGEKAIYHNSWMAGGNMISWDMVHYNVQLIGGVVLHHGKISEMATGEGKTLVATLPIYLNALSGKGVHIVTVNSYLSKRDSEWMGPLFEFHGLTVDCIDKHEPHSDSRKKAYLADITYGTNNEFGFDYLRDNMARSPEEVVQRPHNYAIVDEVDSVLIDDARTPLIISGPTGKTDDAKLFQEMKPKVERLISAQRNYINLVIADAKKYLAQMESANGSLPKKEKEKLEENAGMSLLRAYRGLPKNKALIKLLSESGVKTRLQQTENFYMQDQSKEMHKVDAELYFVIDEKNNSIELTEKGIELLTTATEDHNFFILPDIGSQMAELEKASLVASEKLARKEEITREYTVKAERLHTMQQLLKAYTLFDMNVEYVVENNEVKIVDEQTGRILKGRRYSDGLHQAIEAKENVKIEATTQTFATITLQNYFRMYNKLAGMTGTAETEAGEFWQIYKLDVVTIPTNKAAIRKDMEDLVYKTKREKYNAVIDEIVKLTQEKRPVLVGTTSVEISELLSKMLSLRKINHNVLNAKLHQKEADIIATAGIAGNVTIATNMAGRGTDIKLGAGVKEAGGLAIIGTERHESRRVDRQLRGRSGRQGDPGSSQFFVSLEDNLMRLFGSERIAKLMDTMGLKEGEVIQHSMVTKSIERAQKKVEENNFGIRKRLLEYDDVMSKQRERIYSIRKNALYGDKLSVDIANMIFNTCDLLVSTYKEQNDFENFKLEIFSLFLIDNPPFTESDFQENKIEELIDSLYNKASESYKLKTELISQRAFPVIKNVFENQGQTYKNILVPITDGRIVMQVPCNLEKAYKSNGKEVVRSFEKGIVLTKIDMAWKEHLREMDDLKQSVQNAVYEQKDPLVIYKKEAFELFQRLIDEINRDIVSFLFRANLPVNPPQRVEEAKVQKNADLENAKTNRTETPTFSNPQSTQQSAQHTKPKVQQVVRDAPKIGRNDPCPCGSGKKFKQCHGKDL
jgi:preprotein translocase subunit SecA